MMWDCRFISAIFIGPVALWLYCWRHRHDGPLRYRGDGRQAGGVRAQQRRQPGAARGNFIFAVVILLAIAAALLLAMAAGRAAEPTSAQIAACRDDALRFCTARLGSQDAMRACMVAHKPQLSEACKAAFR
jgi:hypothetical protein